MNCFFDEESVKITKFDLSIQYFSRTSIFVITKKVVIQKKPDNLKEDAGAKCPDFIFNSQKHRSISGTRPNEKLPTHSVRAGHTYDEETHFRHHQAPVPDLDDSYRKEPRLGDRENGMALHGK